MRKQIKNDKCINYITMLLEIYEMYEIIIPTYNESKNIPILIKMIDKQFKRINSKYKIVIVDDSSPDKTADTVTDLQKTYPLDLVVRGSKDGLASAYKCGLDKCTSDFVIIMDADLSHNPQHIVEFINEQRIGNYDIVYGNRYDGGGVYGWSLKRKLMSRGANLLAQFLLGTEQSDLTGSFRLYRRTVLMELLQRVETTGYAVQMEMAIIATRMEFRIKSVGIVFFDRIYGQSKCGFNEVIKFVVAVGKLWIKK